MNLHTAIYHRAGTLPDEVTEIFDLSMRLGSHNGFPWELVAVARIPDGSILTTDPDANHTHFLQIGEERFYARDVLLGKAGPIIVWHRGMIERSLN